jgi:pimeloyl-ACP methyl ester carboxylesterase
LFRTAVSALVFGLALWGQALFGQTSSGPTTVQFSSDPTDVPTGAFAVGPFPADALTVLDRSQATGLRVNLPPSEDSCTSESSPVCSNLASLNQLDGFSINPRLMVCFSGPVNTATLPVGIGLVELPRRAAIGIDQVIFDAKSNCAFAKPASVLNQASQYLLLVSSAVTDRAGKSVVASSAFNTCKTSTPPGYCSALARALTREPAPGGGTLVAASLFSTMDATSWLEKARAYTDSQRPTVTPAGVTSTFQISQLTQFTWVPADTTSGPQNIPLTALANVDAVSFGMYLSPNYLSGATITTGPASPIGTNTVSYHVFTPNVKDPHARIPVVIFGHGLGDSQFGAPTYIASTLAARGFATLTIELPGHGFGPGSYVSLTGVNKKVSTVLTPGRGVQLAPGASIGPTDGCIGFGAVGVRDCGRQAAVDLEALVHAITATNGLGLNLDPRHIYYVGQSFGSTIGTLFAAVDPTVPAFVFNGDGGTSTDIARLALTGRPLGLEFLESLNTPDLLNVANLGAPPEAYFHDKWNDDYVYKGQPPVTNGPSTVGYVPGAMAVQAAFEAPDWLGMLGDPLAFAPHLLRTPLPGVPPKKVLFQFGLGDLEVPNPTESNVVQAAGGQSSTSFLNMQVAAELQPILLGVQDPAYPMLPILPHRVLANPTIFTAGNEAELSLALAEQQQAADFFASNGRSITDGNQYLTAPFSPSDGIFSTPPATLPEILNFLQIPE